MLEKFLEAMFNSRLPSWTVTLVLCVMIFAVGMGALLGLLFVLQVAANALAQTVGGDPEAIYYELRNVVGQMFLGYNVSLWAARKAQKHIDDVLKGLLDKEARAAFGRTLTGGKGE
jgi:hypothetical protein